VRLLHFRTTLAGCLVEPVELTVGEKKNRIWLIWFVEFVCDSDSAATGLTAELWTFNLTDLAFQLVAGSKSLSSVGNGYAGQPYAPDFFPGMCEWVLGLILWKRPSFFNMMNNRHSRAMRLVFVGHLFLCDVRLRKNRFWIRRWYIW
jgi:hypothetical protein